MWLKQKLLLMTVRSTRIIALTVQEFHQLALLMKRILLLILLMIIHVVTRTSLVMAGRWLCLLSSINVLVVLHDLTLRRLVLLLFSHWLQLCVLGELVLL